MAHPYSKEDSGSKGTNSGFALITGASSGIGAAFAQSLAARGRNLVLTARSGDKLETLKSELTSKRKVEVDVLIQDLSVPGAASRIAAQLNERGLQIDLLVNNAGFGLQGEFWKLSLDRQTEMLRLNIGALTELSYLLLPQMIGRKSGGIINVSSVAAFQSVPYLAVYAASKAYVTSFSMALAEEVRPHGVKVLALCPGSTDTNFFAAGQLTEVQYGPKQSADAVAECGLRALEDGKTLTVTRRDNRIMVLAERLVSRRFAARMAGRMLRSAVTPTGQ